MKIEQRKWTSSGWVPAFDDASGSSQLVLVFGANRVFREPGLVARVRRAYPHASIVGCSTAGEICGTEVADDSMVVTAVTFAHSHVREAKVDLGEFGGSFQAGEALAHALPRDLPGAEPGEVEPLVHVFVLSDGLNVNGSALVAGMAGRLPAGIAITGGLAGDADRFCETSLLWQETVATNAIVAVGLYGKRLRVGFGSRSGWDAFGPERLVTRVEGNVLYELDGQSALGLYEKYLGDHAEGLPATALLFPLSVRRSAGQTPVVRTILNVDHAEQSMTFAGDIPPGSQVQLMKANFDHLVDGAMEAASTSRMAIGEGVAELAILISCVGRKLVLKQRIEEEVESVRDVLGAGVPLTGFYSYGEVSPFVPGGRCELHNQTMTITTLAEV